MALLSQANIVKCALLAFAPLDFFILISKLAATETALLAVLESLKLFTVLACMVGLSLATATEVFLTGSASYPELTHMYSGHRRYNLALVILGIVVDLARSGLHHGTTGALDHVLRL